MDAASPSGKGRVALGRLGEDLAASFLHLVGLTLLERNLRVGQKEIDLLMRDGDCLVFVEVRLRRSRRYGSALESVTRRKVERLRAALREDVWRRGWRGPNRLGPCGPGPKGRANTPV